MSSDYPEPLGEENYYQIEERLGYTFQDRSVLARALTHRSAVPASSRADYERFEYLGDAVLDLAVAHILLDEHPKAREGELSKMRAALVNTKSLASVAKKIGLGEFVKLSKAELRNSGTERPALLADVFEAVIGAVYREAGYPKALECVRKLFGDLAPSVQPRDPKTELQELAHARQQETPEYKLVSTEGPEHAPKFVSEVVLDGQVVGRGEGATKKASQQEAASIALDELSERKIKNENNQVNQ